MHRTFVTLALAVVSAAPLGCAGTGGPTTPDQGAALAVVRQFIDGFNAGDLKKAKAVCANEMSIIDDIAPHEWHGASAFDQWVASYDTISRRDAITDGVVTLGDARHVDVSGDRAYVVVAADFAYRQKGKPVSEKGSTLTASLQKSPAGWRITGWAWSKG